MSNHFEKISWLYLISCFLFFVCNSELACPFYTEDDNLLDDVISYMSTLGYTYESGEINFNVADSSSANYQLQIPFVNADSDYGSSLFANNRIVTRLSGRDIILFRGCTPPIVDYFSYRGYLGVRIDQLLTQKILSSSLGDSLNNLIINTENGATYDDTVSIVTTGDMQSYNDLIEALNVNNLDYIVNSINLDSIPQNEDNNENIFTFTANAFQFPMDLWSALLRVVKGNNGIENEIELNEYNEKTFPLHIFRGPTTDGYLPRIPISSESRDSMMDIDCSKDYNSNENGNSENNNNNNNNNDNNDNNNSNNGNNDDNINKCATMTTRENSFNFNVDNVIDYFESRYSMNLVENYQFSFDYGSVLGENDITYPVYIFEYGNWCIENELNCIVDNRDTTYFWVNKSFNINTNENDFYIIFGENYNKFGFSTYDSLGLYYVIDPIYPIFTFTPLYEPYDSLLNSEYGYDTYDISNEINNEFHLQSSNNYFIISVTRPQHCMNDKFASICPSSDVISDDKNMVFFGRSHLNPDTATHPNRDQMVPWRLLHFRIE